MAEEEFLAQLLEMTISVQCNRIPIPLRNARVTPVLTALQCVSTGKVQPREGEYQNKRIFFEGFEVGIYISRVNFMFNRHLSVRCNRGKSEFRPHVSTPELEGSG